MQGLAIAINPAAANAAMAAQVQAEADEARHWNRELKRIDPTLSLVFVPGNATEFEERNCWQLKKEIPGEYDEYWPLLTDEADVAAGKATAVGLYKAPGSWLLDVLNENDLWNPRVHRSRQETRAKFRAAKERAKQRETEQRQDEMALAHRAAKRLKGDSGFMKRTDLILPPAIAAERKAQREAERKAR